MEKSLNNFKEGFSVVYLEHFLNPRFLGSLRDYTHSASLETTKIGCFDYVELRLKVLNGVISNASFRGRLCSGSISAMSLCLSSVVGKPLSEVSNFTTENLEQLWGWVPKGKEHSIELAVHALHLALQSQPQGGDGSCVSKSV